MSGAQRQRVLDATRAWAEAFAGLAAPADIEALLALAAPDIRFTDPFNDAHGTEALRAVLSDMFETCEAPRFEVLDVAASDAAGYVRWRFRFRPKALGKGAVWTASGMSEIHVDEAGRIVAHHDHWDSASQLLVRLPVVGRLVRALLRRLSTVA